VKLLGLGSWVTLPLLSRQAWVPGSGPQTPAIWPESLIPYAPSPLRAVIFLPSHKNEEPPVEVLAEPTTSPDRLIAFPWL